MQIDEEQREVDIKKYINPAKTYRTFKFNNKLYSIGEALLVQSLNATTKAPFYSIGKLIRIIPINGIPSNPNWPAIEVEWFYQKTEVMRTKENGLMKDEYYDAISEDEIFSSNHSDVIYIESVVSKVKVVSLKRYCNMGKHDDNEVYYTRATYDPYTMRINPPPKKWKKYCSCRTPFNPNLMYIKCDKCNEWYHLKCIGLSESDVDKNKNFICQNCL